MYWVIAWLKVTLYDQMVEVNQQWINQADAQAEVDHLSHQKASFQSDHAENTQYVV